MDYLKPQMEAIKFLHKGFGCIGYCRLEGFIGINPGNNAVVIFVPETTFHLDINHRFSEFKLDTLIDVKRAYESASLTAECRLEGKVLLRKIISASGWQTWIDDKLFNQYFKGCKLRICNNPAYSVKVYALGKLVGLLTPRQRVAEK